METMKERIQALARRNRQAASQEEKDAISQEMARLHAEDPKAFTESLEGLIKATANKMDELTMAERMGEATKMVSMAYVARTYFGKSRSWLAHKLNGNIVNGRPAEFTDSERLTLKHALSDMSAKLGSLGVSL